MRKIPNQQIDKRALRVWKIAYFFQSLFFLLIPAFYGVGFYFLDFPFWGLFVITIVVISVMLLFIFLIPYFKWKSWRYDVLEHEIDLQQGILITVRTLIPMNRVQHVDTKQGPLLRYYQLATVTIVTAATIHEIPALSEEVANRLRDRIAQLARVNEDDTE